MTDLFDNKGTSLVFVQLEKGHRIWNEISARINWKELKSDLYLKYNPNIRFSVKNNKKRQKFYKSVTEENLHRVIKPVGKLHRFMRRCKSAVKKLIKKDE